MIVIVIFIVLIGFCATYLIGLTKNAQKQEKELLRLLDELDTSVLAYSILRDRGGRENPMAISAKADVVTDWDNLVLFLIDFWNKTEASKIRGGVRKFLYEKGITVSLKEPPK